MTGPVPPLPALQSLLAADRHDARARGQFVLALKSWVTQDLTRIVRGHFDARLRPELEARLGRSLSDVSREDRQVAGRRLRQERVYRVWAKLSYEAQGMKWRHMDRLLHEHLDELQSAADALMDSHSARGSLTLDPTLDLPRNIAKTEIHRQPRGFCFEYHAHDISSGALYNMGALFGPSVSAGRGALTQGRTAADVLCEQVASRYPGFVPEAVLEVGCGTGRNTPSYRRQFPAARIVAVDCAAGLLRWAFAYAESVGAAIEFRQMDIRRLALADASFDLVTSHIVGHETTADGLPRMLAECWRVLKPGGVMFHMDVPTQPGTIGLCDQVLNEYQVRNNGEPFWMGWADADVSRLMSAAGIPCDAQFIDYVTPPERGSPWFCYGARKPA